MENKFTKGQRVKFERNSSVKADEVEIVASVKKPIQGGSPKQGLQMEDCGVYIIEHEKGFVPDALRQKTFDLSPDKKYLFVEERELTEI